MKLNQKLKFSWGHIIALVALIFISYATFMGVTYYTDGNFIVAGIGVFTVDLLLIIFFIVPQMLKGADEKFRRKIVIERILFFSAPVIFVGAMLPYAHFWTVFNKRADVESTFSKSLTASKDIFDTYEEYANERIYIYDTTLVASGVSEIRHNNAVEALRLQIIGDNYDNLKKNAVEWIDKSSHATVWNVFVIGNIKQIESSIKSWEESLNDFSGKFMTAESDSLSAFSVSVPSVQQAKDNLSSLRQVYQKWETPNMLAIGTSLLLYFLMMFPYIIQKRSTRSVFRLLGKEKNTTLEDSKNTAKVDDSQKGKYRKFII